MSSKRSALRKALRTAHREEVRASALFDALATSLRDAQLHGTMLQFGAQEHGAVALVENLLETRGFSRPGLSPLTSLRATFHGMTARFRTWRSALEDSLEWTDARARRIAEAAGYARYAGDIDAARSLDGLQQSAAAQSKWLSDFLR